MCWYIAEFLFATETMLMLCMTLKRLWIALHIDPTWGTILWNAFCLNHCFFTRTNGKTWKKCPLIPIRNACCLSWVHLQTLFKLWLLFPHKNSNEKQQLMTRCSWVAFRIISPSVALRVAFSVTTDVVVLSRLVINSDVASRSIRHRQRKSLVLLL